MAFLHFGNIGVAALTAVVPSFVQKINLDPESGFAHYANNFIKKIGIKQRHVSITEQTCTDLAYCAMLQALEKSGWDKNSLDGIIFLSQMPDFNPGTGNSFILHKHLNLPARAFAFDITLGCASFPFGLSVGASLMQQKDINRIALISGDNVWSSAPNKNAFLNENIFMFGEGTTAMLLEKNVAVSPIDIGLYSDGSGYEYLFNPVAGHRNRWRQGSSSMILSNGSEIAIPAPTGGNYMDGPEITQFSTTTVVDSIKEFLKYFDSEIGSYDGLILHQANKQIINSIKKRLKADIHVPISLDRYGNTSGASVLLTMSDSYGSMSNGILDLLICTFGIGLAWGIVSLKIDASVIEPVISTDFKFEEGYALKNE